ncbi:outer membrane protein assembly factor BamA [Commensalibacter oyaizuii]|uniref:Outer membrane protein assembly factor BamA n=1 Tax=Commensalibacter oyaizuii TaxID=3043873 RepID=A0ABT6PYZ4_9PROT|nr:outer membrane protein assembly factor BamA [Commensalibacter sp. TBRC 16381]MDI2090072.1 outer membrane protein assembly factor BamA [Commensalibacter sp. TBRC 16381]
MSGKRSALFASVCIFPFVCSSIHAQTTGNVSHSSHDKKAVKGAHHAKGKKSVGKQVTSKGGIIQSIQVIGNDRVEVPTVLSYMLAQPGDPFNRDLLDRSLKTLYATGLFKDITLHRSGNVLQVKVVENPVINRVAYEGNRKLKDADITKYTSLKARAIYSPALISADRQRILAMYAAKGRYSVTVTPQIIHLSRNRVDVIFKINEGPKTLIEKLAFVGNHAFSEARLSQVTSSKETAWYRFLSSSDEYNPERVKYDGELIRRFYLRNGYVDFKLINATGELSPDHKSFYITYTLQEGPQYRLGKVDARSNLEGVSAQKVKSMVAMRKGQIYDGKEIEDVAKYIQENLQAEGHPFAVVRPEIARNPEKKIVDLLFDVMEGPRVYVERIDINGNTVTKDNVIRRELPAAENDPYTSTTEKYMKQAAEDLGYFKEVKVQQAKGSAPDKRSVAINVQEKPTGEFSLGGGYSTDSGILGNIGLRQRNFLGTGVDAGISGTAAYYAKQVNLSVTDPYFLNKNLVAGIDLFYIQNSYQTYQNYSEDRLGASFRLGYAFNNVLSQQWTYSIIDRRVHDIWDRSSYYILDQKGYSLLSQLSTTIAYDTRDSRINPHTGTLVKVGGDFAGIGGDAKYLRGKIDASHYFPLDDITGNRDWTFSLTAGAGYIGDYGSKKDTMIIDNFYLGGNNLRGFYDGGVGPRSHAIQGHDQEDFLGGRFMYTASAQVNFPMPAARDLGLSGRYFVDMGALDGLRVKRRYTNQAQDGARYTGVYGDSLSPRVSTGVGVSWKSPFGLLNVDFGYPVVKQKHDRTQLVRFGFGQQF